MTSKSFEIHPIAKIFPLIEGLAFTEFVNDIKENGLREPITVLDGVILDGRNRYRACQELEIEPATKAFEGGDPLSFVVSKNLRRRHLKDGQRAMIAARLANMPRGRRSDKVTNDGKISQTEAAQLLNVAVRTLEWGRQVEKHCVPLIKTMVETSELSVSAAGKISHLSETEQNRLAARGASAIVAAARKRDRRTGRQGRSEYSILWRRVDDISAALEASRLDNAHIAASSLIKEIARIAKSRKGGQP